MPQMKKILKSKLAKTIVLSIGVLLLIIGTNFLLKSCGSNEKKISFTVAVPNSPNLEKQEDVPPLYITFNGSVSKIEDVQNGLQLSDLFRNIVNCLSFGRPLFNRAKDRGGQQIKPKKQLWHILPNKNNNIFIPTNATIEANVENELMI